MPVRVLHLVSSNGRSAAGRDASRVVPALPAGRVQSLVVELGEPIPLPPQVTTICHRYRYALDLACLAAVRKTANDFRPDVVHARGPLAVRVSAVLRPTSLVVSHADRACDPFTKRLVRRAVAVLVRTDAERDRYGRMGVTHERTREAPWGLDPAAGFDRVALTRTLSVPQGSTVLVASGGFDLNAGLLYAVWAFDILRHLHPALRLVLIGDGPERPRLERVARKLGCGDRVHFVGIRPDADRVVASADLVWLTHRRGGTTFGLEALVAGVPGFGIRTGDSHSLPGPVVALVPDGDPAALSRATHDWLQRPFPTTPARIPVSALAAALADVYDSVAAR